MQAFRVQRIIGLIVTGMVVANYYTSGSQCGANATINSEMQCASDELM